MRARRSSRARSLRRVIPAPPADRDRLPTFVIGGARKAGTTTLWRMLRTHPDIAMADLKEPQFFSRQPGRVDSGDDFGPPRGGTFDRGWEWYLRHFEGTEDRPVRGEASTMYLDAPDSPSLLGSLLPDIKVIFCLRHPVDRVYSHYWYERRSEHLPEFSSMVESRHRRYEWYEDQSRYAHHLRRWFDQFPRSQVHLVLTEDLRSSFQDALAGTCEFLGVEPGLLPERPTAQHNVAARSRSVPLDRLLTKHRGEWSRWLPRRLRPAAHRAKRRVLSLNRSTLDYPAMSAATRSELVARFGSDVDALEEMTGRDLSSWRY